MANRLSTTDFIMNIFHGEKSIDQSAAILGELISELRNEEEMPNRNTERISELKLMISLQEKMVLRMLDEATIQSLTARKKSHLKVVK